MLCVCDELRKIQGSRKAFGTSAGDQSLGVNMPLGDGSFRYVMTFFTRATIGYAGFIASQLLRVEFGRIQQFPSPYGGAGGLRCSLLYVEEFRLLWICMTP